MDHTRLLIRPAVPGDLPAILELYDQARETMRANGTDQWQNGYPNEASALEDMESGIGLVVELEGKVAATAAVYVGHEPTYEAIDGRWLTDTETYGLIHRIAVSSAARGQGVASTLMTLCADMARMAGAVSTRCDTHRGNTPMRRALERNGYHHCGTIYLADGADRVAYERIL